MTDQEIPSRLVRTELEPARHFGDTNWALAVGIAYLVAVSANQYVVIALVGSSEKSQAYIASHGGLVVFATTLTHLLGVLLVAVLVWRRGDGRLRSALYRPSPGLLIGSVLVAAALSLILNATEMWPFAWRWEFDSNTGFVQALLAGSRIVPLLYWLLLYGVGVPILEEVVFRFGLLRTVQDWTGSDRAAVMVSAIIFGLLHLGYPPWSPDLGHMWNAAAVTLFGVALGALVLKQQGRISLAIAVHVTFNVSSQAMLLLAATR